MTSSTLTPIRNFADLYEEERELKSRRKDEYLPLERLLFKADNNGKFYLLNRNDLKEYEVLGPALSQLCSMSGFPKRIAEKLPPDLVEESVQYLLRQLPTRTKEHLIRFDNSNQIRAVLSDEYLKFDVIDMLDLIVNNFGSSIFSWEISKMERSLESFHLRLTKRITRELKVGAKVKDGLNFSVSEVGYASFSVELFELICRCLNGLLGDSPSLDSFKIPHSRSSLKPDKALANLLARGETTWKEIAEIYDKSHSIIIPQPKQVIERINEDFTLGKRLSTSIVEYYDKLKPVAEKDSLVYLSDLYTEFAHVNYPQSDPTYKELEIIGSKLLSNYSKYLSNN